MVLKTAMVLDDLWQSLPDPGSGEETDPAAAERREKRRRQTEKARVASLVAKAKRKDESALSYMIPACATQTFAQRLQKEQLTPAHAASRAKVSAETSHTGQKIGRERGRCVKSFLDAMARAVMKLLGSGDNPTDVPVHVLNTVVSDDTSTRLKSQDQTDLFTIMNTKQSLIVRYGDARTECLHIPTPLQVLPSGKAGSIHAAFRAWLVVTGSGVGAKLLSLGCRQIAASQAHFRTLVLMGHSLRANDAAWQQETAVMRQERESADGGAVAHRTAGLRLRCSNHQLCLVRRPLVLSIPNYWTTLVRLGHLFETHSFKRAFAGAMISFLQKDGNFLRSFIGYSAIYTQLSLGS